MTGWLMDGLVTWLAEQVVDLLSGLMALLAATLFTSPDVTVLPQVTSIAGKSALVVDACFVLAILAVGIATMTGDSVQMRYGVKELVPRLAVGFVLSAFSVPLTGQLITVANALTVSMTGTTAPTTETVAFVKTRVAAAMDNNANTLLIAIIALLIVVLMAMLIGSWFVRVGVLVVLAGIAPVALACYATPWSQGVADVWWRSLLGCLVTPAIQAVAFTGGIDMVINPDANLPVVLGVPASDTFNLVLVVVMLWLTIKIPALVGRYVTRKGSPNAGGLVLRAIVVQGITRRIPLLGGVR
ncbi:conjugal transfer protein TrbL family protein [Paractinoplanes rhizophilus]|uniref:Conjugal transfer protein TrbL family protein n=1 Tax=Paractinoplanes rhizophilus TaxID=1416877 RepID=A0ABW2I409_9ACTN